MIFQMRKETNLKLGQSELGKLKWEITAIKSLVKLPRSRTIPYRFQFQITNDYEYQLQVKVQVRAPSQVLIFRRKTFKKIGRTRLSSIADQTFDIIEHAIPGHKSAKFDFSAYFRPHLATPLKPFLVLHYRIYAQNEERKFVLNSDPYRIRIPVEQSRNPA